MARKPTYEELELRVKELEKESVERKRLEERMHALINAPTETAMLTDLEGTILAANKIAAQRIGKSLEELIGLGMFDYLPRDMAISRKAKADEVVRTGMSVRFQDERTGRSYDNNIYPVFDAKGKVNALAIYAKDITETKRADQALQKSEEKYRTIFENIQDVYFESSLDGVILELSPSIESISKYKRDELIGKSVYNLGN